MTFFFKFSDKILDRFFADRKYFQATEDKLHQSSWLLIILPKGPQIACFLARTDSKRIISKPIQLFF